jgi:NtrC-family two-component system sensor histidine kinase KinB
MARRWNFVSRTSDLYVGKSTLLKIFLLLGVVIVSVVFIWYTFSVIKQLQMDTRAEVERYVKLWQLVANSPTTGGELQFVFNEIIIKATFPIIVLDESKEPLYWRNVADVPSNDTSQAARARLKKEAALMNGVNGEYPLYFAGTHVNYFLYGDSVVINKLKTMPFIQIGIVLAFMIVGIIGFQNIRRSEERHIWVGMAKETAHQLGTPLSSLMGWLEVLGNECGDGAVDGHHENTLAGTLDNMRVDVSRLQRVTNRFSMIGSVPELKPSGVNDLINEVCDYYRRRLPFQGKGIQINFVPGTVPAAPLNPELLGWALENLTKNAIQAVDAKSGRIDIKTAPALDGRHVEIEIADNGKGISATAARKIFRPGFTTKKRGWGLGLTLVKRIIEEYHAGRVWLVRSKPGETVFHILLPMEEQKHKG